MTVLLSHSAFFSAPLPSPLPSLTETTINVSASPIPLGTWLSPSSLPHSYLSLFSSFPIQPREHLSLPKHSILSKGAILLPWTHFPDWKPPTHSLRLNSRATSTVKLPASPRQAFGLLLQSSFYSLCFIALYIIDVYNSVSPNKLPASLRQELCLTSSIFLVPSRVSGTL